MTKELGKQKIEFSETLDKSISEAELRKDKEWLEKIEDIKKNIRVKSEKKANKWSIIYTSLLSLLFIFGIIIAYFSIPYDILDLIISAIGLGGIFGLWKEARIRIRDMLSKRFYTKNLEEAELDKIR